MGRTQLAKATLVELQRRIDFSKKKKKELIIYLQNLNQKYAKKEISYARYIELTHKKVDGRTIKQWIDYYNEYTKDCGQLLKKQKITLLKTRLPLIFFSLIFLLALITSIIYIRPIIVGFFVQEQEFTQTLNLEFNESSTYEWVIENPGQLISAKLSGSFEDKGKIKVYLDDLLILDSQKIKSKPSGITGQAISEPEKTEIPLWKKILGLFGIIGKAVEEDTSDSSEQSEPDSDSSSDSEDTIEEGASQEDSSPSQEEPLSSETQEETDKEIEEQKPETEESQEIIEEEPEEIPENITEEIEEEPEIPENITQEIPENITEEIEEPEEEIEEPEEEEVEEPKEEEEKPPKEEKIITFVDICEETCDLSNLNINKTSYTLKIEITNSNLKLDEIKYKIIKEVVEEPEEIPTNITPITNITANISVITTQSQAVLGQPVKWKKYIELEKPEKVKIELPKEAKNIVVNKITELYPEESPKKPVSKEETKKIKELEKEVKELKKELKEIKEKIKDNETQKQDITSSSIITGKIISIEKKDKSIFDFFKNFFSRITGRLILTEEYEEKIEVIIDEDAKKYEIEYETPAPYATEEETKTGKRVKVTGAETIHYENVLIFTSLNENLNIRNPSRVKIYWVENESYLPVQSLEDKNNNSIYDYIEWIAPILSNQTFEIIVIIKAEHLDENKEFISDIYDQVKDLDELWSETIPESHYIRVVFETKLTSDNDITLYPRITNGNPTIQVYEFNQTTLIAEFTNINSNQYNTVYLTNLISESQDVFDLLILDGKIEIDHIIDPTAGPNVSEIDTLLRPRTCEANDEGDTDQFPDACDGSYPNETDCGAGADLISCDDGSVETHTTLQGVSSREYAGLRANYSNSSITNCDSIDEVFFCYEWWYTSGTVDNCRITVSNGSTESDITTTCPGNSANPGVACLNVTANLTWTCDNFFNASDNESYAESEGQATQEFTTSIFNWDVFYFNISYTEAIVENSPPTHDPPILVPSPLYMSDDIECINQSTSDSDGDSVTNIYNWKINGSSTLLLNMPFDTNESSTTGDIIRDYSGFWNNGTLGDGNASKVPNWTSAGKLGGAHFFDGIDDFIHINKSGSLNNTQNFSIDVWIKPENVTYLGYIFTNYPGGDIEFGQILLYLDTSLQITSYVKNNENTTRIHLSSNKSLTKNSWTHVAVVMDTGNSYRMYIDGEIDSENVSVPSSFWFGYPNNFSIGSLAGGGNNFNGTIDNLRVWNISLTEAQIKQFYEEGINNLTTSTIVAEQALGIQNWTCEVTPNDKIADGITKQNSTDSALGCINIGSSTTLSSDTTACFIFNQSDSVLDCDNNKINGTSAEIKMINASSKNNVTIKDCFIQNAHYPIDFRSTNNFSITNLIIFNTTDYSLEEVNVIGINLTDSSDGNLTNLNITHVLVNSTSILSCYEGDAIGLFIDSTSHRITLENVTISNVNAELQGLDVEGCNPATRPLEGTGIKINGGDNITIYNSVIEGFIDEGIVVTDSLNLNITNSNISDDSGESGICVYIKGTSTSPYIFNNILSDCYLVILQIQDTSNTPTVLNNILEYGEEGLYHTSVGGTIDNNIFRHLSSSDNDDYGVHLNSISVSSFDNNTFFNISNEAGMFVVREVTITNTNITNVTQGFKFGPTSDDAQVINATISEAINDSVILTGAKRIDFTNVSFNKSLLQVEGSGTFFNYYFLKINVTNESFSPIANADVNVSDIFNTSVNNTTGADGLTPIFTLLEFNESNSTRTYFIPYNVTGNKTGYTENSTSVNLTSSITSLLILPTIPNTAPTIPYVSSISNTNPVEGTSKSVIFTITMNDTDGVDNLNDTSVQANFTKSGETTRLNSSCVEISGENTSKSQNYSCTINMWYWDGSGVWNISVYGEDNSGETATNTSTTFTYNLLRGLVLDPASLSWGTISAGATNAKSTSNMTINNTGNYNSTINVTAINLRGAIIQTEYIYAENFTAGVEDHCDQTGVNATFLSNNTAVSINNSNANRGNLSNTGTASGQEQFYWCIPNVATILSSQTYSTNNTGYWSVSYLLVAISFIKRKKKSKDKKLIKALNILTKELQEDYSEQKETIIKLLINEAKKKYKLNNKEISELVEIRREVSIPLSVFSTKLGALEAITKYMKENLNMNYKEIAELLNRNERTIWTAYNKGTMKQKEPLKIKETRIFLPITIFKNKRLTILESLIVCLREKEMKYSEIAKLINRNQKNIWTIYSNAKRKINKSLKT